MKRKRGKIEWESASDILDRIRHIVTKGSLEWVDTKQVYCFRSVNANTRAYARIWGLNRIWQIALQNKPAYCLEVISEKFDRLPQREKDKVLLHELAHIPRNFSGSLTPHTHRGKNNFHDKLKKMISSYDKNN